MTGYKTESWLSDEDLQLINYSDYWNDEEQERSKEWNVLDGNFAKMENHLSANGLPAAIEACVYTAKKRFGCELTGKGIELAAGNLWTVPHLFRLGKIEQLYCLEYSRHRLFNLGPKILDHYSVPAELVTLVFGSFYSINIPDQSLDFVFMSQAFHHADYPDKLLSEINRVLKTGGLVIMIGEEYINLIQRRLKFAVRYILSSIIPNKLQLMMLGRILDRGKLFANRAELFPDDPIMGDHYYSNREYGDMFINHGFDFVALRHSKSIFQSFVLHKC